MTKLSEVKAGDVLIADEGFECIEAGEHKVYSDVLGLYVLCKKGCHYLRGQVGKPGSDIIGFSSPKIPKNF